MKPSLDAMTNIVVSSLSGEARAFYDREFGFFDEVTSISGKLKPFIKKTKPEKKVTKRPIVSLLTFVRLKLTKKWPRSMLPQEFTFLVILTALLLTLTKSRVVRYKAMLK